MSLSDIPSAAISKCSKLRSVSLIICRNVAIPVKPVSSPGTRKAWTWGEPRGVAVGCLGVNTSPNSSTPAYAFPSIVTGESFPEASCREEGNARWVWLICSSAAIRSEEISFSWIVADMPAICHPPSMWANSTASS